MLETDMGCQVKGTLIIEIGSVSNIHSRYS